MATRCYLPSGPPEADAGSPDAEASLDPGPIARSASPDDDDDPHIVRLRAAAVDDRLPSISAPLRTSEWEV